MDEEHGDPNTYTLFMLPEHHVDLGGWITDYFRRRTARKEEKRDSKPPKSVTRKRYSTITVDKQSKRMSLQELPKRLSQIPDMVSFNFLKFNAKRQPIQGYDRLVEPETLPVEPKSPLLRLPWELRMQIYRECVGHDNLYIALHEERLRAFSASGPDRDLDRQYLMDATSVALERRTGILPLFQTCSTIYNEAIDFLYSTPNFVFLHPSAFLIFAHKIPASSFRCIGNLSLDFTKAQVKILGQTDPLADISLDSALTYRSLHTYPTKSFYNQFCGLPGGVEAALGSMAARDRRSLTSVPPASMSNVPPYWQTLCAIMSSIPHLRNLSISVQRKHFNMGSPRDSWSKKNEQSVLGPLEAIAVFARQRFSVQILTTYMTQPEVWVWGYDRFARVLEGGKPAWRALQPYDRTVTLPPPIRDTAAQG